MLTKQSFRVSTLKLLSKVFLYSNSSTDLTYFVTRLLLADKGRKAWELKKGESMFVVYFLFFRRIFSNKSKIPKRGYLDSFKLVITPDCLTLILLASMGKRERRWCYPPPPSRNSFYIFKTFLLFLLTSWHVATWSFNFMTHFVQIFGSYMP